MLSAHRQNFNSNYTYTTFLKFKESLLNGRTLGFRLSETPIFLDKDIGKQFIDVAEYIINRIQSADIKKDNTVIPNDCNVPGEEGKPLILSIDFGICRDSEGKLSPQLIELQAFPSLLCYQAMLGYKAQAIFNIDQRLSLVPNHMNLSQNQYFDKLKKFILGGYKKEEVILLEIFPENQKTRLDYQITEDVIGIKTVHLGDVIKEGKKLYYTLNGKKQQIHRIYNRIIFDDLKKYDLSSFDYKLTDEVEVEWVIHPNWYFKVSKAILPKLNHKNIPTSYFLNEVPQNIDLSKYVLKPLFSFAGAGVNIHPTQMDIDNIEDKHNYILQEKVKYAPVFEDINGDLAVAEVRLMYIWEDGEKEPELIINLTRMSKSEMVNVDQLGKEKIWTGSSIAFFEI